MDSTTPSRSQQRPWRMYSARDGRKVERLAYAGQTPICPCCGGSLEAHADDRACVVLDATTYDLSCPNCRRFWCLVRHTPRSTQLLRMRRLAAAIRGGTPAAPRARPAAPAMSPAR